ncbi:MAG: four helix bundle protein [Planctomycetota bacterium]
MPSEIRSFRDLIAWQKAMALCERMYTISKDFPSDERFGLTAQLRRAAVSVPSNIAEGYGRRSKRDYLRFLNVALGSLCELETQLILSLRLGFMDSDRAGPDMDLLREVDRILCGLIRALRDSEHQGVE